MSFFNLSYATFATIFLVVLVVYYLHTLISWRTRARGRPFPPGPKGLPLIGNMLNMPKTQAWVGFRELCAKHGDVLGFKVLNQPMVILGSPAIIFEFLDRRSANTSNRVQTPTLKLTSHEWAWGLSEYGPKWRHHRRVFWEHFRPAALTRYHTVQRDMAHTFLQKLLNDPEKMEDHIQYTFSATILKITFGIDAAYDNDPTLALVRQGVLGTRQVLVAGGFLVDFFPALQYWPAWLPGGGFQRKFAEWGKATMRLVNAPVERYLEETKHNKAPQCMFTDMLAEARTGDTKAAAYDAMSVARSIGASTFEAGSDTNFSATATFFLAMSLYPEAQRKAQAELDAIVGHERMPDFEDRDALVYVTALIKESMRWINVHPLGLSHSTTEDDELNGYFIPSGTILLANIWACMHDPEVYEDPDVFRPERFIKDGKLDPDVRDPYAYVFGFGRRICPGRHFTDNALFINMVSVLHTFNIVPPLDENGVEIKTLPAMVDGALSIPEEFRCIIKPRGPWAESLISHRTSAI